VSDPASTAHADPTGRQLSCCALPVAHETDRRGACPPREVGAGRRCRHSSAAGRPPPDAVAGWPWAVCPTDQYALHRLPGQRCQILRTWPGRETARQSRRHAGRGPRTHGPRPSTAPCPDHTAPRRSLLRVGRAAPRQPLPGSISASSRSRRLGRGTADAARRAPFRAPLASDEFPPPRRPGGAGGGGRGDGGGGRSAVRHPWRLRGAETIDGPGPEGVTGKGRPDRGRPALPRLTNHPHRGRGESPPCFEVQEKGVRPWWTPR